MGYRFNIFTGNFDLVGMTSVPAGTVTSSSGSSTDNGIVTFDGTTGAIIQDNSSATLDDTGNLTATSFIGSGTSLTGVEKTANKGAANGYASLDNNSLVPINQIPPAALERLIIVTDQTARFALTTATAQNGDTVYQQDTSTMYMVKDDTNLGNASGYQVYSAGTAVNFSGSLSGDVTGGQSSTLVSKIQGTTVSGTTGSGNVVFSTSPTLITPALGTPSSVVLTSATGLPLTSGVTGILPLANGGTNSTSAQSAINTLAGSVTSGQYLRGNGANVVMSTIQAGDVPTLNQNTTGTASNITASSNSTLTTLSSLSLPGSQVTGNISGNAANVTGVVAIANGGTGTTTSTGTGSVVLSSGPSLVNPIVGTQSQNDNSTKGASTAYVDLAVSNAIAGVNPAVAVNAATTLASDTSGLTYNNGVSGIGATLTGANNTALTIDGFTFTALGQRLLVKNDTQSPSGAFNGIYYVTQLQASVLPLILTRALDYDQSSDINNTGAIPVISGTTNADTSWLLTSLVTTVGTDPLTYRIFTSRVSAGDISETSFTAADNQSSAANVTGCLFSNSIVRSADILLSIVRNTTYAQYKIHVIQGASSWYIDQQYLGDVTGLTFTITSAGQLQYTSSSTGSTAALRFRALTTSV